MTRLVKLAVEVLDSLFGSLVPADGAGEPLFQILAAQPVLPAVVT